MQLILRNLLVALFLVGLSCANALEHYPRPWETPDGSPNYGFLQMLMGETFIAGGSAGASSNPIYGTLDEMQLGMLNAEYGKADGIKTELDNALDYKEKADSAEEEMRSLALTNTGYEATTYISYWTACVESAFTALDLSAAKVNDLRSQIGTIKEEFRGGGVCDNDYSGPNVNYCWVGIEDVSCNNSGTFENWPDLAWYPDCAKEHWQKIDLLELQLENISAAYSQTVQTCGDYVLAAKAAKTPADNEIARLEAEKLDLIYESGSGACSSGAQGISGAYLELEDAKGKGDAALSAAEGSRSGKGDRWLKVCIGQSAEASAAYGHLMDNCLITEANEVVNAKKADAEAALKAATQKENLLDEYGKASLELAKSECKAAENGALGNRYENYIKCKENAGIASDSLGKNPQVETAKLDASFKDVGDLLDRAKQDGLDVDAQEKIYEILLSTKPANSEAELASLKEQIINAAKMRYGGLEGERTQLKGMVAAGKGKLDYLLSWFEAEECFSNNKISYECAIGRLGEIEKSYSDIRAELTEANAPALLEGALLVDSSESWTAAVLDQGGDAYLYVNAVNPLDVGASNVKITVPASLDYRKVDVVEGAGEVLMVSSSNGKAEIYLANVSAYENIWIVFKKEDTPCRTTSATEKAWGDTLGGAYVEETVLFSCEHAVESLDLGRNDVDGATLDGVALSASGGIVSREIAKGAHTVKIEKYDPDAYSATKEMGLVSTVGQKTHVEYFVVFQPKRDMDYLTYVVSENGKEIEGLEVFGYTGEKISEASVLGGNAISFKAAGLKKDKETRVRIGYYISNAKEYVNASIAYYQTQNLTAQEQGLLGQAETLAAANDYDAAYAKIGEIAEKIRQDGAAYEKILLKHNKLREELEGKKALLSEALNLAQELNVSNGVTAEMQARLGAINRALGLQLERGMLTGPLENFDMGWENKELAKISTELAAGEKKIKDGWVASGASDQELAGTIEQIEKANSRFDGAKQFDDAMRAYAILALGGSQVENATADAKAKGTLDKAALGFATNAANGLWAKYNSEYSEASGGHWEGLFPESASSLSKKITALAARKDYAQATADANKLIATMNDTLGVLAEQEAGLYASTNGLFQQMKGQMDEKDSSVVQGALDSAAGYAGDGQFVRAMKSLEGAVSTMQGAGKKQDGLLIIALTGLLVLGVVALYMLRDKIPKNILPKQKERGKEYKKLKREAKDSGDEIS